MWVQLHIHTIIPTLVQLRLDHKEGLMHTPQAQIKQLERGSDDSLLWRHNDHDSVSNHQPHGCLISRLFRHRSKKTSKLRVTGLCAGNSPGPVNFPHKGPVTRNMFPFDDVIMLTQFPEKQISSPEIYGKTSLVVYSNWKCWWDWSYQRN